MINHLESALNNPSFIASLAFLLVGLAAMLCILCSLATSSWESRAEEAAELERQQLARNVATRERLQREGWFDRIDSWMLDFDRLNAN